MKMLPKVIGSIVAIALLHGIAAAKPKQNPAPVPDPAAMEAAKQLMTPGENHRRLDPLIGRWHATVTMWMAPDAPPEKSEGKADNSWVLGNHFIQTNYHGTFNGGPFEGIGLTGYDNVRQEYQFVWLDNFATGMMIGAGSAKDATTVEQSGTFGCPMTGEKHRWYRTETKILGPNKNVYTSYAKAPDGKEFKGMEIVYDRVAQ